MWVDQLLWPSVYGSALSGFYALPSPVGLTNLGTGVSPLGFGAGGLINGPAGLLPFQAGPPMTPVGSVGNLGGQSAAGAWSGPLGTQLGGGVSGTIQPLQGGTTATVGAAPPQTPAALTPQAEVGALNDLLGGASAGLIKRLYEYLNANSQQYQQLTSLIPLVSDAATAFQGRNYQQSFAQTYQAIRALAALRTAQPAMPQIV
jgi:hypothetical protein